MSIVVESHYSLKCCWRHCLSMYTGDKIGPFWLEGKTNKRIRVVKQIRLHASALVHSSLSDTVIHIKPIQTIARKVVHLYASFQNSPITTSHWKQAWTSVDLLYFEYFPHKIYCSKHFFLFAILYNGVPALWQSVRKLKKEVDWDTLQGSHLLLACLQQEQRIQILVYIPRTQCSYKGLKKEKDQVFTSNKEFVPNISLHILLEIFHSTACFKMTDIFKFILLCSKLFAAMT